MNLAYFRSTFSALTIAIIIYLLIFSHHSTLTIALVISTFVMTAFSWISAANLLGLRSAAKMALISIVLGMFAEFTGTHYGWFFGDYHFTEVLGPKLWEVPIVIPLMWFALAYIGYIMANFIFWQTAVHQPTTVGQMVLTAFMAALLVTAFDLGADPFFVYGIEAWIMFKKDGAWFGETIQGFFGWMTVTFVIVMIFQTWNRTTLRVPIPDKNKIISIIPLSNYGSFMIFQMIFGTPAETRVIAFFAMGIPMLIASVQWSRWQDQLKNKNSFHAN